MSDKSSLFRAATIHRKLLIKVIFIIALLIVLFGMFNYFLIETYSKYIINKQDTGVQLDHNSTVGIVLGGGIEQGRPRPLLKDRLDAAAGLINERKVRKLIVSGDNRFLNYDEPAAMRNYLIQEKGISPELIQMDSAGRSTYESCERAKAIFSLNQVLLISESTHLPRAIYTCRSFGIEAYGYSSDGQAATELKASQRFREVLARTKAIINIYIIGEDTVLGPKIEI